MIQVMPVYVFPNRQGNHVAYSLILNPPSRILDDDISKRGIFAN